MIQETPRNSSIDSVSTRLPALSHDVEQRILKKAILSRRAEEQFLKLFEQGKLSGTVHTCIGQEFSGAVVTEFLVPGDAIFSNHRCHGHFLSFLGDIAGLTAEVMGKSSGVCGGLGGSQHLCKDSFFSNGVLGSTAPISAGLAFARKLQDNQKIAVLFLGDGALGEGVVYETLNLASKWKLPLLVVLENNGCAQSTDQTETLAGDILDRAKAFEIRTSQGSTWDWKDLYHKCAELIPYVRMESKPCFLQIDTFRLKAHSKGDDLRPPSLIEHFEKTDPLHLLSLQQPSRYCALVSETDQKIEDALQVAILSPFPQLPTETTAIHKPVWRNLETPRMRLSQALRETFADLMHKNTKLFFVGEDVRDPYGGAFKISQGLSARFPDRVLNTPVSESAIVGLCTGLAMEGYRPFVEIMFGDFLTLATDSIVNSATKFEQMFNGQVKVNLVIRTPMGGHRGYGPTHSQTLDRLFLGIPGLTVLALNSLLDPRLALERLVSTDCGPTLLLENKILYSTYLREQAPQGFELLFSDDPFPIARLKPQAEKIDVTLLGYGGMSDVLVEVAQALFQKYELVAQVICPQQIYPFEIHSILDELKLCSRVALIEEGQGFGSWGSEVAAQIFEKTGSTHFSLKRILPEVCCIPASRPLEDQVLPTVNNILPKIVSWVHGT